LRSETIYQKRQESLPFFIACSGDFLGGYPMDLTGKPAVPFALPDSQGKMHHLTDYTGFWLLLVFHRHLG
jgi:hypothetical protein